MLRLWKSELRLVRSDINPGEKVTCVFVNRFLYATYERRKSIAFSFLNMIIIVIILVCIFLFCPWDSNGTGGRSY